MSWRWTAKTYTSDSVSCIVLLRLGLFKQAEGGVWRKPLECGD